MKNYEIKALLIGLTKLGCSRKYTRVNKAELALDLDVSAWTLNRWIREAINRGLVNILKDGRASLYKITERGLIELLDLKKLLEDQLEDFISMKGLVTKGLSEGAYYMSIPEYEEMLHKALGFKPYPGTLNVKILEKYVPLRRILEKYEKPITTGFKKNSKEFGGVGFLRAEIINDSGRKETCAVLFIEKTKHGPDIIEVVAPVNLREKLNLKDGSEVKLIIYLSS
ncbi:MAG: hypothetical protein DRJ41_01015 [Thermoprotei archaeon]|nr:MAG: hypothetical protein DRJ41_01015 [Thermoprotei archaeon]